MIRAALGHLREIARALLHLPPLEKWRTARSTTSPAASRVGVPATDPLNCRIAVVVLLAVGVLASVLPARRALLVDLLKQQRGG
ncbi:MAG: hypothetical protein ABI910_15535 [Gemmatimonadota bacterium]